jgi:hypothetical protein
VNGHEQKKRSVRASRKMEDKKMKKTALMGKNLWKKVSVLSVSALLGVSLMACGAKGDSASQTKAETSAEAKESTKEAEVKESTKEAEAKESTKAAEAKDGTKAAEAKEEELKGKISDIKDFMFTVTTDDGKSYALNFDKKPEGLDKLKDGDEVVVHYTGELSEVDPFEGEILSIEKA